MKEKERSSARPEKKKESWWSRHKPTKRRLIQLYVALLCNANIKGYFTGRIYSGGTKNFCVPGLNCYSCPGAVGACPLGALQNAFAQSGTRAPFYVFGILLLLGILLGRTICGFLCPFGFAQDLAYKIKTPKLKKNRITRVFSYFKYVILAVFVVAIPLLYSLTQTPVPAFCKYICPAGTFGGAIGLLINPSNSSLYASLGPLFTWKFIVLVVMLAACVFIYRFFCRFFCPLGAIYGFFNKIAFLGVKLDRNKCTDCGLCVDRCKMDIRHVGDHECINCGECIEVCPAKAISWKGSKLLLHRNAVEPVETEKPLAFAAASEEAGNAIVAKTEVRDTVIPETVASEAAVAAEKPSGKKRFQSAFWLRFAAWAAALAVLVTALVYYNFIDVTKTEVQTGNNVGDACYDFSLPLSLQEGNFTLSDYRGRIVVVNFWATWCGGCVTELPEFERVAEEFSNDVVIVAIHSSLVTEDVREYLNTHKDIYDPSRTWSDYTIRFAQDSGTNLESETFLKLGGQGSYPITVVVDREGLIANRYDAEVSYDELRSEVTRLL